ncbi:hypothetical protein GJ496_008331 [Pomphorhynchus laevis]|nr:hypothetical protein GJ496_008331 [Pomphorhynchus laevis]
MLNGKECGDKGEVRWLQLRQNGTCETVHPNSILAGCTLHSAYVCDEIITARSGVKVCIGNTDAEGRMAMADVLCYAKEKAISSVNPSLFTIATLTGHVGNVYGPGYAVF